MKTHLKKLFLPSILLTFMFAFMFTSRAGAAYGLTQTNPQPNSITVQWAPESDALGYTVYMGTSSSDAVVKGNPSASTNSFTISGLTPGTEYYIKVEYTYKPSYSAQNSTRSVGSGYFMTTPGKVTNLHQDRWYYFLLSFDAGWDRQASGTKYEYIVKTSKGKKKAAGTTTSNSLSVGKISNSMIYTVQVRASNVINNVTYTGPWSDVCYCFTQPRVKYAKVKGNKLTIKWGKVTGATGYDVYVSTKPKKGYKKVKSVKSKASSVTISKLKGKKISPKKKYYLYVVTKKKVNGKTNTSGRLYYWNTKSTRFDYF